MTTAVVIASGETPSPEHLGDLWDAEFVIAADSGAAPAHRLGFVLTHVVGDMDSILDEDLQRARRGGAEEHTYPTDKNSTDLELALELAVSLADNLVVLGMEGGRTDHVLGNWAAVAGAIMKGTVEARTASGTTHVVRSLQTFQGEPGDTLSVSPWGGRASGVTVTGVRWSLENATLLPTSTLGISNKFASSTVEVTVETGVLLVTRPHSV